MTRKVRMIPDGIAPERRRICEVALAEVGTRERPWASNRGPVERYMPGWQIRALEREDAEAGRLVRGPPWCAFYATWVWRQALERHPLGAHIGSVRAMRERAVERALWIQLEQSRDADLIEGPAPGDAWLRLDDDRLQGHVEIILRVSRDGREYVCAGGNTGHAVRVGRRSVTEPGFRGVISVTGDLGRGTWERGLGDVDAEDVGGMGTR